MQLFNTFQTGGQPSLSNTAILRRKTVSSLTGKSRSTLYRDIAKGLFTAPVNIGGGRVGWPCYEVEKINKARVAGADDEVIKALVAELEANRISSEI